MRQVIAAIWRAGRRFGIVRRKRGRHTAAYLADAAPQQRATTDAPDRRRHAAPATTREFRQPAPREFGARAALKALRRETPPVAPNGDSRPRTTRGAMLRVMTHGIRLDQVFAAAMPVAPPDDPPDVALLRRVLVGLQTTL